MRTCAAHSVPEGVCLRRDARLRWSAPVLDLVTGGTIENAQAVAARESAPTTKLYDRTSGEIALDEVQPARI